ncbi:hypothetical protein VP01_3426g1 [Puccinia sorghi]|uniref:Phosphatidylinositol N-acetylglucosaminyltransferase subunit H conserved domain-containing protein n=1 Tax=Puccinia sorghi TaxID=27349 RepID=A0A0L6UWF0_9BASI|nr:hypothetical protein VP01_3426g1 [Puccinia sorghi]
MSTGAERLTIKQLSTTTTLYQLHSNRPVFRTYQDGLLIATLALIIPFLVSSTLTWPSLWANISLILLLVWTTRKLATVYSGLSFLRESVLILGPLGIQFSSTSLIRVTRQFVPREHIRQAIIHEAIVGWHVVFYLALVVQPDGGPMYIHQVFHNLEPRLNNLVTVWKGIRAVMFQEARHEEQTKPLSDPKHSAQPLPSPRLEDHPP